MSVKKMKNNDQVYDILLPPTGATTLPLDLFGCFPAFLLNWLVIYVRLLWVLESDESHLPDQRGGIGLIRVLKSCEPRTEHRFCAMARNGT